mmetsp:Transcript_4345/g.4878  ORF Transcript_4345/g.4878 Transcript_4345/m.4878 type:complete len:601 (+) Transcript_4345:277-2079(+)
MADIPETTLKRPVHLKVGTEIVFAPIVILLDEKTRSTGLYQQYLKETLSPYENAENLPPVQDSVLKPKPIVIELPEENGSAKEVQKIINYLTIGEAGVTSSDFKNIAEFQQLREACEKYRVAGLLDLLSRMDGRQPPAVTAPSSEESKNELEGNFVSIQPESSCPAIIPPSPTESMKKAYEERRRILEQKAEAIRKELDNLELEMRAKLNKKSGNRKEAAVIVRLRDKLEVELQSIQYIRDQTVLAERHEGKSLAYNLLVVGVTGTGKSSSLNTLLDKQLCKVSGGQAQGTRGCNMQDGSISGDHFVSFIDTQGLGADTTITDEELISQIMMSAESVNKMGIINNVLISFDLANRQTPAVMANQLTLMELFGELRSSCFLIFTKWNTNSVQSEWNTPLKKWVRKWRRKRRIEDITEDPPSYPEMYKAYCDYIVSSLANQEDGGSFSKMGTFLAFFEARVLWMFNLDGIQIEDKQDDDLEPYVERLYTFYRNLALETLHRGRGQHHVEDLTFLKSNEDTLASVAQELVSERNRKIDYLESIGRKSSSLAKMQDVFRHMAEDNTERMKQKILTNSEKSYMDEIAVIAGVQEQKSKKIGCVMS